MQAVTPPGPSYLFDKADQFPVVWKMDQQPGSPVMGSPLNPDLLFPFHLA